MTSGKLTYSQGMQLVDQLRADGKRASWHAVGGLGWVVVTWHA